MNEATNKVIQELAIKLGTTTELLWGILIHQAYVSAVKDAIYLIIGVLVWVFGVKFIRKHWGCEESGYEIIMLLVGVLMIIFLIVSFTSIDDMINCLANPQFAALDFILGKIK